MSCQIKVLIAEDEKHARDKLKYLLSQFDLCEFILREADDGLKAVELIQDWSPQLIIVDIHMPHINGLEVVKQLSNDNKPLVIFTTAYEAYALEAFEVEAIDYLLKPFAYDRLHKAINRVLDRINLLASKEEESNTNEKVQSLTGLDKNKTSSYLTYIRVESTGRLQSLLSLNEVYLIKSSGNYCEFYTSDRSYIRRGTLKDLVARLSPDLFLRLNRSEVVQINQINSVEVIAHGDAIIRLKAGQELKWSRHYRAENGAMFEV
jgi:two-component system LytT family response regulator